jgi:GNAT superfamily N-acetyltransferase
MKMKETIELQYVEDDKKATEREHRAMHELALVFNREELPEDPPEPYEEWLSDLRTSPSDRQSSHWLAWDQDGKRLMGSSVFSRKYRDENRYIGRVSVGIRPQHRGKGLAAPLLLPAAEAAKADGRTLSKGWVFVDGPGVGFADAVGAKTAMLDYHNRLTIADLDVPMLHSWVERAKERASDYSLLFWEGECPPDLLQKFANLRMVMNTAPRSESDEDEKITPEMVAEWDGLAAAEGYSPWNYVAQHDPTDEWAGYTRMWPGIYRKEFAYQDDTAVRPDHRDRGLGRWLKATMLLKVMDKLPDTRWIETWNATTNEAMLGINRALGFKAIQVWQEREIQTEDLLTWLRERA